MNSTDLPLRKARRVQAFDPGRPTAAPEEEQKGESRDSFYPLQPPLSMICCKSTGTLAPGLS
jgi:hypothetical protein